LFKWFNKRRRHTADGFLIENEHRPDCSPNTRVSTAFEIFFVLDTLDAPEDTGKQNTRGSILPARSQQQISICYIY
jgi:hypothetical protein